MSQSAQAMAGDIYCAQHGWACGGYHQDFPVSGCMPPPRELANLWMKCVVCDEEMPQWDKPICDPCCAAIRAFRTVAVEEK